MCAVGKCMNSNLSLESKMNLNVLVKNLPYNNTIDDLLKDQYKGHPIEFWQDVQELHDGFYLDYWDNSGITDLGMQRLQELKEKYKD
jgi:hypothetical protein